MKISRRAFTKTSVALLGASLTAGPMPPAEGKSPTAPGNDPANEQGGSGAKSFQMGGGTLEITALSDSMIHVTFTPAGAIPKTKQFAVLPQARSSVLCTERSEGKSVTLSTAKVQVKVSLESGALKFLDGNDRVLLQEFDGNGEPEQFTRKFIKVNVNGEETFNVTNVFLPAQDEAFYGLGQHQAGVMNLRGEYVPLRQENTDVSIPVMISTRGYGMFWNNASPSTFDNRFPSLLKWNSEVGESVDYYFLYGPGADQIIACYRELTGRVPMFPKWAYGFFQSKDHYENQGEVLEIAAEYRRRHIPLDVIVQDWQWWITQGEGVFRPNYGDPEAMMKALHDQHIHAMISVWPYFDKKDHGSYRDEMAKKGAFVSGTTLIDPTSSATRRVYWEQISRSLLSKGFDAWWLDAAEPEYYGQSDNFLADRRISIGSGARYANIYPLLHTQGVYEGQRASAPNRRVFILARSSYAGQQRNSVTTWSGDTQGTFWAFSRQIPAGLNFVLSGIPYWTTDIGGYGYPDAPNTGDPAYQELFTRWFQYGVFCPIFRVHGRRENNRNEIYAYGPGESILTDYDRLRYRLMTYIYSLAAQVTRDHYTMMRPLVMDWPEDLKTWGIGDQFMFGPALMVNPVTEAGARQRSVYLPKAAQWYDFWSGKAQSGENRIPADAPLERIPLFVRAGSILPLGPIIEYAAEKTDPIELRIYRGSDGAFNLYDDENDGYGYEEGRFSVIPIQWNESSQTITLGARQGSFPGMPQQRIFQVVWVNEDHGTGITTTATPDHTVTYDGQIVSIQAP